MKTGYKYLIGAGVLFVALKLWSDSQRIAAMVKGSPTDTKGSNAVGGITITTPSANDLAAANPEAFSTDKGATTREDANPSVEWNNPYFRPAV